jgi:hypothetical protein
MDHGRFISIPAIKGKLHLPFHAAVHARIAFQTLQIAVGRFDTHAQIPDTPDDVQRLIVARCEVHGMTFARLRLNGTSKMRRDK